MKTAALPSKSAARDAAEAFDPAEFAFSLIEILVTVGLLSFIILGLLGMFTQTQRAFRSSMTQTDMLESGRAVMSIIAPELSQITAVPLTRTTNFLAEIPRVQNWNFAQVSAPGFVPLSQNLPGAVTPAASRTNIIERFFFLRRLNQDWIGTGYSVVGDYDNSGVGTLYRFYATNTPKWGPINLSSNFLSTPPTNGARLADGVVHFRVRTFDASGSMIAPTNFGYLAAQNLTLPDVTGQWNWYNVEAYFTNKTTPAYVELELGVLESRVLDRYRGIGSLNPAAQRAYLADHAAQVHIFRQLIPVREVDKSAYQ